MNRFLAIAADARVWAAVAAAAGVFGGVSGQKAASTSEDALEAALRRQSEAQLAGFELCRSMTEKRAERADVTTTVVPPVPNSLKTLAKEPAKEE